MTNKNDMQIIIKVKDQEVKYSASGLFDEKDTIRVRTERNTDPMKQDDLTKLLEMVIKYTIDQVFDNPDEFFEVVKEHNVKSLLKMGMPEEIIDNILNKGGEKKNDDNTTIIH